MQKQRRSLSRPVRRPVQRLALEQRIVFDGALPVAAVDAAQAEPAHDVAPPATDRVEAPAAAPVATPTERAPVRATGAALRGPEAETQTEVTDTAGIGAPMPAPLQIAFVDAAVQDIEAYLPDFKGEVITLSADRDAMAQIAEALAHRTGVAAIHILSHGTSGELQIGNGVVNAETLARPEHQADLAAIKAALTAEADILIYGCDVAAGEKGQQFIDTLADKTGADVAASTDTTGSAELGGNWNLEAHTAHIEATGLSLTSWNGALAFTNTATGGPWVFTSAAANTATVPTTAVNTTDGVKTTVTLSGAANVWTGTAVQTLNNIAAFSNGAQNTADFTTTFNSAAGAGVTGTVTITFDRAVIDPIIHVDRIGGIASGISNSSVWTLTTAGASLTKLAGPAHLLVTGTTFQRQLGITTSGAESSLSNTTGTAAGSMRVAGTYTSLTFTVTGSADGIELAFAIDGPPVANNDTFTTPHDTPFTVNVRANDTDPTADALTVTQVNGTAIIAGGASVAVTGGSVALTSGGDLLYTPTAGFVGATSFTYTIADPIGNTASATVSGTVVDAAPVVDLNSGSTPTERITNGGFTGGASGWTTSGSTGTAGGTSFQWDSDGAAGTLTQSGLTGLNNGYGAFGAAQVTVGLGWNNSPLDSTVPATLDVSVGGVVYARFTTNRDGVGGTIGTLTYLNGASGPVTTVTASTYAAWTYSNLTINLPANVAASGNLVFSFDAGSGGRDDIAIDNVSILTRTDTVAGNNFSTNYTENGAPQPIAAATSEVRDIDDTNIESATIVLTNAQAGDVLSVIGSLPAGITASAYNSATGVISLSGSAPLAQYATAIRAIGFSSTSENPSTVSRTINVTVNDGDLTSNTAVTTIAVTAVNDAPVAGADNYTTPEERPITFDPRSNDTDAEGDALTITQVNGTAITADSVGVTVTGGIVVMNTSGTLSFIPNLNYAGSGTFTYTVRDPSGATSTGTVTMNVTAVNDAPVIDLNGPTTATTALTSDGARDTAAPTNSWEVLLYSGSFAVAGTSGSSSADRTTGGAAGAPVLHGEIYLGQDDAPLVIRDDSIAAGERAQNVLIRSGNQYGGTYTVNGTNGDFNPAGGAIFQYVARRAMTSSGTITLGQPGAAIDDFAEIFVNGTRVAQSLNATTSLGSPLTANFNAGDVVEIRMTNNGGTGAFTLDATITNVNHATSYTENAAPVSIASAVSEVRDPDSTNIASATIVLTNAQAGDLLSVTSTLPAGITASAYNSGTGTLTLSGSATLAQYNTAIRAIGFSNSTDTPATVNRTVTVKVNDGTADSAVATTTITVTAVNDAPVATNDTFTLAEDSGSATINVRANDTDPEGDTFTVTQVNGTAITAGGAGVAVTGGVVTLNASGNLVFTPTPDYNGSPSFTYTVTDPSGATSTATVTGTVTPVNDAPTSTAPAAVTAAEDTTVTFTAGNALSVADVDGGPLTVTLSVTNGTLTMGTLTGLTFATGDGTADATMTFSGTQAQLNAALASLSFAPTADYNGSASLTFNTTDGSLSANKTVALTITPVADIVADSVSTNEDTALTFNAITGTNGASADNFENAGRAVTSVTQGANGTVSFAADGTLTYTPAANYNGPDSFTYTVTSGGVTETATVSVTVTAVNDAPTSTAPASASLTEDATFAFTAGNALSVSDVDGGSLTVTLSVTNGTLTMATLAGLTFTTGDGTTDATMTFSGSQAALNTALASLSFVPTADYYGAASLSFSTTDGTLSAAKTVALTITPVADVVNDTVATAEDTAVTFNVLTGTNGASADNFENAGRAVTAVTQGANGTVTFAADGTLTYTPAANYFGTDSFTYTVTSGGVTETATVTVNVSAVNDAPTSSAPASVSGAEDTVQAFTGGNALSVSDLDSASLTVTLSVTNGLLTMGTLTGLSFSTGDGTADATMTFSGTQAQLNAALASLSFAPTADYNGPASLSFNTSDGALAASKTIAITVTPVVDIVADSITTAEDTAVTFNVLTGTNGASADNFENGGATVTAVTQGAHGTVSFAANGTLVYTPAANYFGSDSFSYTVTSGGTTETATVTMTITAVNDAPVAVNDSFSVAEDTPATITVRANDSDVDGDTLTVTQVNGSAITAGGAGVPVTGGVVTLNGAGNLVFTPNANYNGSPSFTYTVADGNGGSATATVNGTVTPVNDAPVATDDSFTTLEDTAATVTVRANDTDVDGDTLTITRVNGTAITAGGAGVSVTGGVVTLTAAGNLVFTPTANYNGAPSFTYTVADPGGLSSTATVNGTVTPVNDAPVAANDSFTLAEDSGTATINVRANDTDPEGDTLTVTQVNGTAITAGGAGVAVTGGVVTLDGAGNLVFTPNANYNGSPSFTYTVADPSGATSTATVNGTVTPVNDTPTSTAPASVTLSEDTTAGFSGASALSVADVDGTPLTVTLSVTNGTLTMGTLTGLSFATGDGSADATMTFTGTQAALNAALASLTFTPVADYNGSASLSFDTTDGTLSTSKSVALTITPVADAVTDNVSTAEDTAITFNALTGSNGASADNFENGARVVTAVTQGAHGSVSFSADGTLVYTPDANYNGPDSFLYSVTSGGVVEIGTVNVNVTAVNDAPALGAPASASIGEDGSLAFTGGNTLSVADVDNGTLTVTLSVTNGTLTMGTLTGLSFATGDGSADASMTFSGTQAQLNAALASLTFAPTADYFGAAALSFSVTDGSLSTARAVSLTVTPVADIVADTVTTNEDTAVTFNVLTGTNGASADNFENGARAVTSVTQGANGSVSFAADGTLVYTPAANFSGTDTFTYTVTSGGATETATVTVNVASVDDAPVTTAPASVSLAEDATLAFTSGNALTVADVDNPSLTVTLSVTNGTLTMGTLAGLTFTTGDGAADGTMSFSGTQAALNAALASLTFAPTADYHGSAALSFTTSDGTLATSKTVALTINPVVDIVADSITTAEDTAVTFNVLTGTNGASADNFENGGAAVTSVTQGIHGSVSFAADGTLTYTPAANYFGADSFSYTVTSGGVTETTTVTMAITSVNDAPVAVNDSFTVAEDNSSTITVLANDSDVDGDTLTVTQVNGTAINAGGAGVAVTGGTVTLDSAGRLLYTPNLNYNGSPSFTYTVADGRGGSTTATVNGTVTPVNDAPVAVADTGTATEDAGTTGTVLANDTDVDGDTLTVSAVAGAAGNVALPVAGNNGGLFTVLANGSYTFVSNGQFEDLATGQSRTTSVTYQVSDGHGGTATTTLTVTVTGVNDAPLAVADSFDTVDTAGSPSGTPLAGSVVLNDTDAEHAVLVVSAVNGSGANVGSPLAGLYGTLTLNADGSFSYAVDRSNLMVAALLRGAPALTESFAYTASDGAGGVSSTTLTVRINGTNDSPFAGNDTNAMAQGEISASGNVITGLRTTGDGTTTTAAGAVDTDPNGDPLSVYELRLPGEASGATVAAGTPGSRTGAYGTLTINADGSYTYVLNNASPAVLALLPGQQATDTFVYSITDGGSAVDATVTVTIGGTNDAPVAVADTFTTAEDTSVSIDVRGNDSDPDADPFTVTQVNGQAITAGGAGVAVTGGTVTLDVTGKLVFAPNANYNGSTSFTYTIADPSGATATATVSGTVTPVNDAPVAANDSFTVAEDNAATIVVRANDTDVDGDTLTVTQVAGQAITAGGAAIAVTGGSVTLTAAGNLVFTPGANFNGSTSFSYVVADPSGATSTATVNGIVTPVNDAPIANADSFTVAEDTPVTIVVRGNDTDVDGDTLTVTQVNGSAITAGGAGVTVTGGVVTLTAAGNLVFTPNPNYNGSPSFTYTVADPGGLTSTATVSGTVTPVNDAPVAVADSFTTAEDTAVTINVRGNDTDVDGDTLTVTQVDGQAITAGGAAIAVTGGSVSLNLAGNLVFTPSANYNGSPSFTYTLADPAGLASTATVSGTVTPVNDAPVAVDDTFTTAEDTAATIVVRGNDTDVDGDTLTVTQVNGTAITAGGAGVAVTGGVVTLNGAGNLVFTPSLNYNGSPSFTYTVADPGGLTSTATVSGTVTPVNDAPVAANDSFTVNEDTPATIDVRANDTDVDGDTLTVTQVNGTALSAGGASVAVTGGSVALDLSGRLVFTPAANFNGSASFTYTVADPGGLTSTASVNGTVTPVNDAPVAVNDSFTVNEDTPATIVVRGNDTDADGDTLTVTQVNGTAITAGGAGVTVTGGVVTLNGAGNLVFTPNLNVNGSPSFTYTVADPSGATSTATVNGTVNPVNDAPVANADSFSVAEDTSTVIDVLANDIDVDGDMVSLILVDGQSLSVGGPGVPVAGGIVALDSLNRLVFTPTANSNGTVSFTYTITDASGASATASVGGTVTAVNDAPVAANDSFTVAEDTPVTINVRSNDTDVDGDALTVTQVNGTAITAGGAGVAVTGGVVTLNGAGNLVFTPSLNYNGSPSFTYTVADLAGLTSTATVSGTVTPVNDAPVANADSFTVAEDTPATLVVRGNDTDVDGDTLTVTQINGTAITAGGAGVAVTGGVVTLNGAGNLVFTPNANYNGSPSFTYTVADPSGLVSTATVSGTVTPVNDAPVAVNDSFTVAEDTPATIDVRANDTDLDGDALTVTQVNGSAITAGGAGVTVTGGVVTLTAAGNLVFTPALNYNGSPSFTYTVADAGGLTSTATVSGTVTPVNDAPVAVADLGTATEDAGTTGNVVVNDTDADGDTLSVSAVAGSPANLAAAIAGSNGGLFTVQANGAYAFSSNGQFDDLAGGQTRSTSVSYTVTDSNGGSATASLTVTVTGLDDAPVAAADTFTVAEDTPVTINVRANDTDAEGGTLTVTQINGTAITAGGASVAVTGGTVALTAAGNLVFMPALNYNGSPSFTYTLADPTGLTSTATVSGTVTPVNDAPVAANDSFTVAEDNAATINVRGNDSDVDGDALTVTQVNGNAITVGGAGVAVTGGVVTLSAAGDLVFTPNANYNGPSSFTYTVADPSGLTSTATVNGTITPVNDAPVAAADTFTTAEDTPATINVRANDSDVDADALTVTQVNGTAITAGGAGVAVTGGVVTLTAAGNLVFTPSVNYNGSPSFTYTVADPGGLTSTASVSGTVTAANDAPVAAADSFTIAEDGVATIDARANDSDVDGDAFTITQVNGSAITAGGAGVAVSGGVVTLSAAGNLVFTPNANYNGSSSFTYTIADPSGATATATVSGTVTPVNDAPAAAADSFTVAEDTPVTINVRANDSDVDGDTITVTQVNGSAITAGGAGVAVTGGVVTLNAAGNLVFTPALNYNGSPSFTYTVADPGGLTSTATVSGTVTPVNDTPVAAADSFTVAEDTPATIDVRGNDSDADGDALTVTQVNGTAISAGGAGVPVVGGVVTLNAAGNLVFTPTLNYNGSPSFTYSVADPSGATATATVSGTVTPVNDAPVAVADSFTVAEDSAVTINVRTNDSDADGDAFSVTQINGTAITAGGAGVAVTGGVVTLNAAGNLVFTPNANYNGSPSFTYTVADAGGLTSTATVSGTVTPVNDAPVAVADGFTVNEDNTATIAVRGNDTDLDGDVLTVTQVNGTAITAGGAGVAVTGGVVTLNLAGNLVYTPNLNYNGSPSFSYTVADPSGATSTAVVSGTVTPVNDAPAATADTFTTAEDTPATIVVRANDSDVDGDALTVTQVNGTAITAGGAGVAVTGGVVTLNAAGNLVFTPALDYNGSPSFTYTVADAGGLSSTATVSGTVAPVNDAPVAVADLGTATEDAGTTGNVVANDTDADGDTLSVSAVEGSPANLASAIAGSNGGLFTVQASGAYTFSSNGQFEDLAAGQTRTTTVSYTVSDGRGGSALTTLTVTVTGINDAPVAVADTFDTVDTAGPPGNIPLSGTVLANDTDAERATLTVNAVNGSGAGVGASVAGSYGTLVLNADGTFSYAVDRANPTVVALLRGQPALIETFTYTTTDGVGGTATTTLTIRVNGTNDSPFAGNDTNDITQGEPSASGNVITGLRVTGSGTSSTVPSAFDSDPNGDPIRVDEIRLPADTLGSAVSASTPGTRTGTYGTITIAADGSYTYTLDNASPTVLALLPGQVATDSFVYTITDGASSVDATITITIGGSNDAPVANDDTNTTLAGTATTGNVLTNDTDPDPGQVLSVTAVAGAPGGVGTAVAGSTGGLFTLNADGSYRFDPNGDFANLPAGATRSSSVTYTLEDGFGGVATATLSVTVTGQNDAPVAAADTFTIAEDTPVTINVRANDTDADGETLTITQVDGRPITAGGAGIAVSGGTVTLTAAGNLVFTPNLNYNGPAAFTYTVADPSGTPSTASVSGTVTPVNDAPVAVADSFTVAEDTPITLDVRANDSDVDGDTFTVTRINGTPIVAGAGGVAVTGGVVTLNAAGNLVFTPNANYTGSPSFTYTVADTSGFATTTSVSGTVTPVNDAPVAVADAFTVTEDTPVTIDVRANDSDVDGDAISITQVNGTAIVAGGAGVAVTGGTVTLTAAGNLVFTPAANYNGTPSFTYTLADPSGVTSIATVSGTVTPVNDAPAAAADSFSVAEDGSVLINVRANDTDVDGDTLSVTQVNGTAITAGGAGVAVTGGVVTLDGAGNLVFTPAANYNGSPSFTYTVADPAGATSTATVSGTVTPVNDAPVAVADTFTTAEDTPATIDVRANDTDADGDAVSVTQVNGTAIVAGGAGVAVTGGVVTLNAAGNLVFTPTANYNGSPSFTYTVADPSGATSTATVSGTVTPVNDVPVAAADSFSVAEDTVVLINVRGNDTDADGDALTVTQVNGTAITAGGAGVAVTGGVVTLDGAGNLVFTPAANFNGSPNFTYTVADPSGATSNATVSGTVTPVNDAPVAAADGFTIAEDSVATIDVRANDTDADGDALTVTQINGTAITAGGAGIAVTGGVVTLNAAGNLVFTPTPNYNGSPSFTYTVTDPTGLTATATVSGTVTPANDAPVAVADSFTSAEDTVAIVAVRANDTDADGDTLTVTRVNGNAITVGGPGVAVTGGTVTLDGAGNLVFTPTANYFGASSFTYTVTDPSGATSTATVSGTVTPVNDAPVAVADSASTLVNTPVTINVLANDSDVEGPLDPASVQLAGTVNPGDSLVVAGEGTWSISATTGAITFTPLPLFSGAATPVLYSVADSAGLRTAPVAVSVNVVFVNHAPTAAADTFTTAEDTPVTFDVRANDSDVDGDMLSVTQVNGQPISAGGAGEAVTGGVVTLNAAGNLVFTPNANFTGAPSFSVTVTDPGGLSATSTVSGNVTPVNDAPVANADSFIATEDAPLTFDPRLNDTDVEGDALTVTQVNGTPITAGGPAVAVTGGSVTLNAAGSLVFTPTANYNGPVSFGYTVADPSGAVSSAVASGTVTPANDAPVAAADTFTVAEDTPVTIDVRANDSDVDGNPLTVTQVNGRAITAGGPGVAVTGGVVTVDGAGRLVFTPAADYTGSPSFSYTVADPSGATSTAIVSGTVTPANDAPVANADAFTTAEDTATTIDVRANDRDVDGDVLTVTRVNGNAITAGGAGVAVTGGVVTLTGAGTLVFTPAANFNGPVAFGYTVADPSGATSTATVNGAVTPVNDAPAAAPTTFATAEDTAVTIDVLAGASDADGDALRVTQVDGQPISAGGPAVGVAGGTVTLTAAGQLVFTPAADYHGPVAFTYTVADPSGASATATARGTVAPVNDAPEAAAITVAVRNGATVVIDALAAARDVDGDALAVTAIDGQPIRSGGPGVVVAGGVVTLGADGTLLYTPTPRTAPTASRFTYTVTDPSGATATASITVLDDPDRAPAGAAPSYTRTPTAAPIIEMSPALHVLGSVSEARSALVLGNALGAMPLDAVTAAEITAGVNADLSFAAGDAFQPTGRTVGTVTGLSDTLFVQHAVRHEGFAEGHALFVQKAVRESQTESRLANARASALNSSAPGVASLFDPFALGAPKPLDPASASASSTAASAAEPARAAAPATGTPVAERLDRDVPTDATAGTAVLPSTDADLTLEAALKPRPRGAAPGFAAQLRANATEFRARTARGPAEPPPGVGPAAR